MTTKRCPRRGITKPLSQWGINKAHSNGLQSCCKKCHKELKKKWYKTEAGKAARKRYKQGPSGMKAKRRALLKSYGMTVEDYDRMFQEQNGVCAVCGLSETSIGNGGNLKPLAVDHNHKTGKIRGLICSTCNTSLGGFQVDELGIELLTSAISYIRNTDERSI